MTPVMPVKCPDELQAPLFEILNYGISMMRRYANRGESDKCAVEADHVQNVPDLIRLFNTDLLAYYLDIEVPQYLRDTDGKVVDAMRRAWDVLKKWRLANGASSP